MLRPPSRKVRRAHSAHSRIRSTPTLPQSPTPIYTGTGNILYIDATPPGSVVSMRDENDFDDIVPTPSLINGRPIMRRTRHYTDQPQRVSRKPSATGRSYAPPLNSHFERRNSSGTNRPSSRSKNNHHQSNSNLSNKSGSTFYNPPQVITRWYELDDTGSQTSLASDCGRYVPPKLMIQPPSSHDLSVPEPESSKDYLNSYPPSPYEFDSETIGPFSAAFEEMEGISPSASFYGANGYVPSPLAFDGQTSTRSNILHVPMSPISPYTVIRPKSPAPSFGSQITLSTIPARPAPVHQSSPVEIKGTYSDNRDQTRVNLMPKLNEEELSESTKRSVKTSGSPSHTSHSVDCLESSTKTSVCADSGEKDLGHTTSSPSLNKFNPSVFRFPHPPSSSNRRGRYGSAQTSNRQEYRSRTLSRLPRSTSQTSVQSLSLRSDISASAASVISTHSDMWGGRRGGPGHARFMRQYYSYRRPSVQSTRGQRAYKSFRQELLLRSMLCVGMLRVISRLSDEGRC